MDRGGVSTFYHKDGLGSVTELSDISQGQVGSYKYDVFGSVRSQTGSVNNPYLFTSRRLDPESGLYYYRARYYNANIGRFISRDPILQRKFPTPGCESCGFTSRDLVLDLVNSPQSLHPYVYVDNNPVNYIDPTGLCCTPKFHPVEYWICIAACDIWCWTACLGSFCGWCITVPILARKAACGACALVVAVPCAVICGHACADFCAEVATYCDPPQQE